jgi:transcriptional regulator with XRE-family HTH domain
MPRAGSFGANPDHPLARWCRETGTSLSDVARRARVTRQHLYKIMDGRADPRVDVLRRISGATLGGVATAELMRVDGGPGRGVAQPVPAPPGAAGP